MLRDRIWLKAVCLVTRYGRVKEKLISWNFFNFIRKNLYGNIYFGLAYTDIGLKSLKTRIILGIVRFLREFRKENLYTCERAIIRETKIFTLETDIVTLETDFAMLKNESVKVV